MMIKRDIVRVSINLPRELVDYVRKYASDLGINITSAYILLLQCGVFNTDRK